MSSPVADVLRDISVAFGRLKLGWYLFGAQAALLRGSRRLTADVDVTVLPGQCTTHDIVEALERRGLRLRVADVDDFVARTRVLPMVHTATQMPVDVVLGGPGLEESFLERSEPVRVGELDVLVPRPEDLVIMKLLAGRATDLDDAAALVRANPSFDLALVQQTIAKIAAALGEDEVTRALETLQDRLGTGPG